LGFQIKNQGVGEFDMKNNKAFDGNLNSVSGEKISKPKKKNKFMTREMGLFLVILASSITLSVLTPRFLQPNNLLAVTVGLTFDLLMALGMTLILIVGGIDLSVGSILGLTGVITTLLLRSGLNIPLSILLGLGTSFLAGSTIGIGVTRFNIPPFIASLGMMSIARGAATVLTSGYFVTGLPDGYKVLGQGLWFGIPIPIWIAALLVFLFTYFLKNWGPLVKTFYIGSNPKAAELSGINVKLITYASYVICSLMAGLAAIFQTARLGMGYAQMGLGAELRAIAAAVIGGASLAGGGEGSIIGTFLGVMLLAIINNGFVLLNASIYWQGVVNGLILVIAVAVDAIRQVRMNRE
jgi:ribose transport system permease protein